MKSQSFCTTHPRPPTLQLVDDVEKRTQIVYIEQYLVVSPGHPSQHCWCLMRRHSSEVLSTQLDPRAVDSQYFNGAETVGGSGHCIYTIHSKSRFLEFQCPVCHLSCHVKWCWVWPLTALVSNKPQHFRCLNDILTPLLRDQLLLYTGTCLLPYFISIRFNNLDLKCHYFNKQATLIHY